MQKNVLVTGASTGIGFDCVRNLTENGFTVIATVRKPEDQLNLEKNFGTSVKVLLLDVSDFAAVEQIPEKLKSEFQITELFGLVNNAGVALAAPYVYQDFSEVEYILRINVLALMKVTQVLIPLLKKSSGRIVNMSSIAGKSVAPFLTIYAASKHAVEAFSEGLRKELIHYNMKVIVVGPGSINTPIWQKGFEVIKTKYDNTDFAESFHIFSKMASAQAKNSLAPSAVSDCVLKALTDDDPCFRYAPIPNKLVNWYIPRFLPERLLNKLTAKALKL
ncbi:MAG: SDR family NAD(P)-dependent oxidoreductase [Pseudobdellovibrio sp.]